MDPTNNTSMSSVLYPFHHVNVLFFSVIRMRKFRDLVRVTVLFLRKKKKKCVYSLPSFLM